MFKKKSKKQQSVIPGGQWSVKDVCDWLSTLQMQEYSGNFKKNKIDGAALLALTNDDLQSLGIGVLGHRKKLLAGINVINARLRGQPVGGPPQGQGGAPGGAQPQPVATIGLIARNIGGKVRIFDTETGEEVLDIAAHQKQKQEELAAKEATGGAAPDAPGAEEPKQEGDAMLSASGYAAPPRPKAPEAAASDEDAAPPPRPTKTDEDRPPPRPGKPATTTSDSSEAPPPRPGKPMADSQDADLPPRPAKTAGDEIPPPRPAKIADDVPVVMAATDVGLYQNFQVPTDSEEVVVMPNSSYYQNDEVTVDGGDMSKSGTLSKRVPAVPSGPAANAIENRIDEAAKRQPWFQPTLGFSQSMKNLEGQTNKTFLITNDIDDTTSLALLYVADNAVCQATINNSQRGLHLSNSGAYFANLSDFVDFYSRENEEIPYMLGHAGPATSAAVGQPPRPSGPQTIVVGPDAHLDAIWYLKDTPKEKAIELIEYEADGSFIVRDSRSEPGCFALSYVSGSRVQHKLVETTASGLRFRLANTFFDSLSELIQHYLNDTGSEIKCSLALPRDRETVKQHRLVCMAQNPVDNGSSMVQADVLAAQRAASWKKGQLLTGQKPTWDCLDMSRDDAMKKIKRGAHGAFVIRPSDKSFAALSMITPGGPYHMHIIKDAKGLHFKKQNAPAFPDLFGLVEYYSKPSQGELPCPLIGV